MNLAVLSVLLAFSLVQRKSLIIVVVRLLFGCERRYQLLLNQFGVYFALKVSLVNFAFVLYGR